MNLNRVKKYIINLKDRPQRLSEVTLEFNKLNWEFERFEGINTNSYIGCLQSHLEIIKIAKNNNLENVLIAEDDIIITPWTHSLIDTVNPLFELLEFGVLNLNMSIHRPVNLSRESSYLLDLTNLPPKQENHRGIYSTGLIVYNKSVYSDMLKINYDGTTQHNPRGHSKAIDEHLYEHIYPKHKSFSTVVPFSTQKKNYSDVSGAENNNHYIQTYNWNVYTPAVIDKKWFSEANIYNEVNQLDFKSIYASR